MNPMEILGGGFSLSSPASSDAGGYAPVWSEGTTGVFNFGPGAGSGASGQGLPMELIIVMGLLAWIVYSQR